MPNWIEGNIKVRGAEKDLYKFFSKAFSYYSLKHVKQNGKLDLITVKDESKIKIYHGDDDECYAEIEIPADCYLEGTRRAFINANESVYFEDITSEEQRTICVSLRQAWEWSIENYISLSEKYNVDIKVIGWECGMCYKGEVEVIRGQEPKYMETKYDDWEWETEFPNLGG